MAPTLKQWKERWLQALRDAHGDLPDEELLRVHEEKRRQAVADREREHQRQNT
ncbi:MAG: hypothetical protein HY319_09010 [Armatimonadetes bacterium]|nr:hypothetical protein [Armatimonadota bacterium]